MGEGYVNESIDVPKLEKDFKKKSSVIWGFHVLLEELGFSESKSYSAELQSECKFNPKAYIFYNSALNVQILARDAEVPAMKISAILYNPWCMPF